MNPKSFLKGTIGLLFVLVGSFFIYLFVAVLPAIDCTEVWSNGKLIQHSCRSIYYNIASYRVSGEVVGWVIFAFEAVLFLLGLWIVWRAIKTLSLDSGYPDER